MKQLLLITILFLFTLTSLKASEKTQEENTWNIIAERFFNGIHSNVIRFEDDIEFKLTTVVTPEDSAIIKEIIIELNDLIEIVDVRFAENYGNFTIALLTKNHRLSKKQSMRIARGKIESVRLEIITEQFSNIAEKRRYYYYYIFRNLIKAHEPGLTFADYNGVFASNSFPQFTNLSNIDKDIIQKLYSQDSPKNLKANIIFNKGFLFYLNLKYKIWVQIISSLIALVLVILGFLYLLSTETKLKTNTGFWNYFKKGCLILGVITFVLWIYRLPDNIPFFEFVNIFFHFFASSAEVFSYGIFAIILMYYTERRVLHKIDNFFQKQIIIFLSTTFSILIFYAIVSLPFIFLNSKNSSISANYTEHINISIIFNILIVASVRILYNFINFRMQSLVNQKDVELAKMKELKNQAELNALHSRINPHFLYNSLNSIAGLAHTNPDKTENMATGLSELFRYSINKENKTFVTIDEELEMVKRYLEIEKTRFGERLVYTTKVDQNARNMPIPKFLIQPIVENAIKHGVSKSKETGIISLEIIQLDRDLVITIFDNGPDFPEEPVSGYGLQNLNDKLEIIYGTEAFINWENGDNKHFKITLKNQF